MPDTITHIQTIAQPVEVSVKVGLEIDSKGQRKPSVEIKTTYHLTADEAKPEGAISTLVGATLIGSLTRCIETVKKAMEEK